MQITFWPIKTKVACLVVRQSPYDFIVGCPSMKKMPASLDFEKDSATFRQSEGATCIPLVTERAPVGSP